MGRFSVWIDKVLEEKATTPDYSIDRWIKSAQQLGSQVDSFVSDAKEKESEADKKFDKKKKDDEKKDKKDKGKDDKLPFDPKDKNWNELKKIHKERLEKDKSWKTSSPQNSSTSTKKN